MPTVASQERITAKLVPALERLLDGGETFTEISVAALMTEAGLSRRTFYVYFDDKAGLLREIAEDLIAELATTIDAWLTLGHDATREDLGRTLTQMAGAYEPHRLLMRAIAQTATNDAGLAAIYDAQLQNVTGRIAAHLRTAQVAGSARADIDAPTMAAWLTTLLAGGFSQLVGAGAGRKRQLDAATQIIWRTIYAQARA